MAKKIYEPTRMCTACRTRTAQNNLLRLRCQEGKLISYNKVGRSFYFCTVCLKDEKKIAKALMRECRSGKKDQLMSKLKEIVTNE